MSSPSPHNKPAPLCVPSARVGVIAAAISISRQNLHAQRRAHLILPKPGLCRSKAWSPTALCAAKRPRRGIGSPSSQIMSRPSSSSSLHRVISCASHRRINVTRSKSCRIVPVARGSSISPQRARLRRRLISSPNTLINNHRSWRISLHAHQLSWRLGGGQEATKTSIEAA